MSDRFSALNAMSLPHASVTALMVYIYLLGEPPPPPPKFSNT